MGYTGHPSGCCQSPGDRQGLWDMGQDPHLLQGSSVGWIPPNQLLRGPPASSPPPRGDSPTRTSERGPRTRSPRVEDAPREGHSHPHPATHSRRGIPHFRGTPPDPLDPRRDPLEATPIPRGTHGDPLPAPLTRLEVILEHLAPKKRAEGHGCARRPGPVPLAPAPPRPRLRHRPAAGRGRCGAADTRGSRYPRGGPSSAPPSSVGNAGPRSPAQAPGDAERGGGGGEGGTRGGARTRCGPADAPALAAGAG